jgi:ABC-type lipoprotein export system ATPase subunit
MPPGEALVVLRDVVKDYHALRPLRIQRLELHEGASLALLGFDAAAAEVLASLITGASLPDSGDVRIFGKATREIVEPESWLRELDRFGIFSERVALLDQFTAEQNLAIPFSLDLLGLPADVRISVRDLALEVGLSDADLPKPIGALSPAARARIRLGKALALGPQVVLAEHPNALLPRDDVGSFARDYARIISQRRVASLVVTADRSFAAAVAEQVLSLQPATGELNVMSRWRRWF